MCVIVMTAFVSAGGSSNSRWIIYTARNQRQGVLASASVSADPMERESDSEGGDLGSARECGALLSSVVAHSDDVLECDVLVVQ